MEHAPPSRRRIVNLLTIVLSGLADAIYTARRRWRCIRTGHRLLCITDGHVCTRCGRFYGYWD